MARCTSLISTTRPWRTTTPAEPSTAGQRRTATDRDHYFGRIWRVDHKQAKEDRGADLTKATPRAGESAGTPESSCAPERAALLAEAAGN